MNPAGRDDAKLTIANGGTTTNSFRMGARRALAIYTPTMTGTTFSFTASVDNSNFYAVHDNAGNLITFTLAAGKWITLTADKLAALQPFQFLKVVSGSAEAAARTLLVAMK